MSNADQSLFRTEIKHENGQKSNKKLDETHIKTKKWQQKMCKSKLDEIKSSSVFASSQKRSKWKI